MSAIMDKLIILFYYFKTVLRKFHSRSELERYQTRGLMKWMKSTLPKSQFYKNRLPVPSLSALLSLEPIDKNAMMMNFDQLNTAGLSKEDCMQLALKSEQSRDFSPTIGDITVGLSSGTSGHRGLFLVSRKERLKHAGTMLAKVLPNSIFSKNRVAFFLRANSNLYSTSKSRFLDFCFFDLLTPLEEHLKQLNDLQPTLVIAPPSILRMLAAYTQQGSLRIQPLKIVSVAETLDPLDQKFIEKNFHQSVHQVYQCTEGFLGITCRLGTLHLNEDLVYFQKQWIDRAQRKFIPILTDFTRETQPIIRYRLNDILTEKAVACACGSPLLAIESIEGRCDDIARFLKKNSKDTAEVLPDFIRRCVLFASQHIEEYHIKNTAPGQFTIGLKFSTNAPEQKITQQEIQNQFNELADQLNCQSPQLQFTSELPAAGIKKLRRVETTFALTSCS